MLTPIEVNAIKEKRALINATIEQNQQTRETRFLHGTASSLTFFNTMLSVSLALGAAIIPLILLGKDLDKESSSFLILASAVLIGNAIILLLTMKGLSEFLSVSSFPFGLAERLMLVKWRNLLTKSILTKDPQYFALFNTDTRATVNELLSDAQEGPKLAYQTDVGIFLLVVGLLLAFRPLVNVNFVQYLIGSSIILYFLLVYLFKGIIKQQNLMKKFEKLSADLAKEEKNFNDFVNEMVKHSK